MAQSVATTLTNSYVEIAAAATWVSFQIIGAGDAEIYFGTTPASKPGFVFKNLDGGNPATWGDDKLYAKAKGALGGIIIIHAV